MNFVRTYKAMKEGRLSGHKEMTKPELFESITKILRNESNDTLNKVVWLLAMRRKGMVQLQHVAWGLEPEAVDMLNCISQLSPNGLLPKGMVGYYSVSPRVTVAIHELVDLVRDLKVIGVLKEDDA